MLSNSQDYWLNTFIDHKNSSIWPSMGISKSNSDVNQRKHRQWKAEFNSYEHALINYPAEFAKLDGNAVLYFSRKDAVNSQLAYGYSSDLVLTVPVALSSIERVQKITVSNLKYGFLLSH
jgi:hypothetical protein